MSHVGAQHGAACWMLTRTCGASRCIRPTERGAAVAAARPRGCALHPGGGGPDVALLAAAAKTGT
eukprot:9116411-Lingulodinium_polyedra.AAC.1